VPVAYSRKDRCHDRAVNWIQLDRRLDAAADHFLPPTISGRQTADWLTSLDFPCQGVLHSSLGLLALQLIGSRQDRRLELAFRSRGVDVFTCADELDVSSARAV